MFPELLKVRALLALIIASFILPPFTIHYGEKFRVGVEKNSSLLSLNMTNASSSSPSDQRQVNFSSSLPPAQSNNGSIIHIRHSKPLVIATSALITSAIVACLTCYCCFGNCCGRPCPRIKREPVKNRRRVRKTTTTTTTVKRIAIATTIMVVLGGVPTSEAECACRRDAIVCDGADVKTASLMPCVGFVSTLRIAANAYGFRCQDLDAVRGLEKLVFASSTQCRLLKPCLCQFQFDCQDNGECCSNYACIKVDGHYSVKLGLGLGIFFGVGSLLIGISVVCRFYCGWHIRRLFRALGRERANGREMVEIRTTTTPAASLPAAPHRRPPPPPPPPPPAFNPSAPTLPSNYPTGGKTLLEVTKVTKKKKVIEEVDDYESANS